MSYPRFLRWFVPRLIGVIRGALWLIGGDGLAERFEKIYFGTVYDTAYRRHQHGDRVSDIVRDLWATFGKRFPAPTKEVVTRLIRTTAWEKRLERTT